MSLAWAVIITVGAAGVAIAAMLFVRRNAPDGSYFADGDRAAGVFGVIATGLSVLLGLIVLAAVLFAASRFFGGLSLRMRTDSGQKLILGMGYVLLIGAAIWVSTFPVNVAI
jgi:hypothetical protein